MIKRNKTILKINVLKFMQVAIAWLHDSYIESFYMQAAYSTACASLQNLKHLAIAGATCYREQLIKLVINFIFFNVVEYNNIYTVHLFES